MIRKFYKHTYFHKYIYICICIYISYSDYLPHLVFSFLWSLSVYTLSLSLSLPFRPSPHTPISQGTTMHVRFFDARTSVKDLRSLSPATCPQTKVRCVTLRNIIRRLLWGSLVCVSSCSSLHQFSAAPSFNSSLRQNPTRWTPTILERSEVDQGGGSNRHTPRTRPGVGRATPQREIHKP